MGAIKILDESLSNMIAAGEVVENPASLVKELLENSLDAKSNFIRIDIKNGGKYVKIIDNGKGMSKEDLLLCIERHATSKISTKDDLFNLITYGFRGEALSSIAAVSKMTLSSKQEEDEVGHSINVIGGKITNLKDLQRNRGTEIEIKDLFFNTPARLKFLKKDSTEIGKIKDMVLHEALCNPNVSIILTIDGKENIRTSGKGIENTIIELFNYQTLKKMKPFKFGYMGNLDLTRSNKDYLFTSVNGRPVKSKIIEEAILDGYYTKLMKGKYPFILLNLEINPREIDINVHPSKKIVKFSNEKEIYDLIYNEIIESLDGDIDFSGTTLDFLTFEKDKNEEVEIEINEKENNFEIPKSEPISLKEFEFFEKTFEEKENSKNKIFNISSENENKISDKKEIYKNFEKIEKISNPSMEIQKNMVYTKEERNFIKEPKKEFPIKIIGQFANTFILTEENNDLIIYDQHIVHERILYEKLKDEYNNKKIISQNLLVPIKISLSEKEVDILKSKKEYFENFGFEIDEFNKNEYLIRAVPSLSIKDSFENIFFEILHGLKKINSKNEVVENMIISMSCKGAVKANTKLSFEEMEKILFELHEIGNFTCPHGRPITMKITLKDLEKGFRRR